MHLMIAWGSPDPSASLTAQDHARIEAVLSQYAFVSAFPGCGVCSVTDNQQRLAVEEEIVAVIKASMLGRVRLLISPPMGPGNIYRGFLSQGTWEPLNAKVQQ
jgi:hypothetical protein